MDIFRINDGLTGEGELLNNINNIMWVERYLDSGEFSIKCPATEYFRTKLAPGTFISHTNTDEVMMVQTQIIDETKEGELQLEVSGKSIEAVLMENRVFDYVYGGSGVPGEPVINGYSDVKLDINFNSSDPNFSFKPTSWLVAKYLITSVCANTVGNQGGVNNLSYDEIISSRTNYNDPPTTKTEYNVPKLANVYTLVKELLASTNTGIKGIRVTPVVNQTPFKIVVHQGQTRVGYNIGDSTVTFSLAAGDLESVRYLWQFNPIIRAISYSNNYGLPYPTYNMTAPAIYPENIPTGAYRWGVRVVTSDAGDLSAYYSTPFVAGDPTRLSSLFETNSKIAIAQEKKATIIDAKVSKNAKYKYKQDYDIGDIVWVSGNYEATEIMRVTEHAEIIDENGESSIPTLTPWLG